jgi:hypothetical protein
MRKIIQKLVDTPRRAIVPFHTAVPALRRLIRDGVFHHVAEAAIPIAKENAVALLLVDLDGRYEQRPEGVGRNMNIHGLKFLYWTLQDRSYFIIHMPGTNFHKKKRPLNAAFSYLGLRA